MVTEKEEQEVFKKNLKEAIEEAKEPEPKGKLQGYLGIAIGLIGIFMPQIVAIFTGVLTAVLGVYANKHGQRVLGIICGFLALWQLIWFFMSIQFW